jgi:hypothetical protein
VLHIGVYYNRRITHPVPRGPGFPLLARACQLGVGRSSGPLRNFCGLGRLSTGQQPGARFKIQYGMMPGMGKRAWMAVMALMGAVALLLGGCTSDPEPNTSTVAPADPAPTTSTPPTSASPTPTPRPYPADVPLTGHNVKPGEKPPLYPAAAKARTQAGANAFAEFYMRTLDWAYATTNPSYMKHYTGPSCGLCNGLATGISKTAAKKHWYLGGRFTLHPAASTPIAPVTAPADYCSRMSVDTTAESVVDKTGKVFNGDGAYRDLKVKICAKFTASGWQTTYFARS